MSKLLINLFWFKRDLRLIDNVPLQISCDSKYPTLLFYLFEPSIIKDEHYSERHMVFVKESILDINNEVDYNIKGKGKLNRILGR